MLATLAELQTGQETRKASHCLHEQRCLQGKRRTHEFLELQRLQASFLLSSFSSCSLLSSSHESQQTDSASSALLLIKTILSLTCSRVLLRSITIASFALANLCHDSLSISAFLKQASSSIALLVACIKSSSFCLIKFIAFDSTLFNTAPSCCFLCSSRADLNLSLYSYIPKKINKLTILRQEIEKKINLKRTHEDFYLNM